MQELLKKRELLPQDIRWHLIGHLQSNKAKYIVPFINLVHSIDSLETARELSKRALGIGRTLDILIEINVAREASKEGVSVAETELLFHRIVESATSLNVCGLMTVAPFEADPAMVRPYFHELLRIRDKLGIRELSMGMTNDFEIAIEEGATMIRIGSALFGSRVSQNN